VFGRDKVMFGQGHEVEMGSKGTGVWKGNMYEGDMAMEWI